MSSNWESPPPSGHTRAINVPSMFQPHGWLNRSQFVPSTKSPSRRKNIRLPVSSSSSPCLKRSAKSPTKQHVGTSTHQPKPSRSRSSPFGTRLACLRRKPTLRQICQTRFSKDKPGGHTTLGQTYSHTLGSNFLLLGSAKCWTPDRASKINRHPPSHEFDT